MKFGLQMPGERVRQPVASGAGGRISTGVSIMRALINHFFLLFQTLPRLDKTLSPSPLWKKIYQWR